MRIAVISLVPHAGHLVPSLRVASAIGSDGDTIKVFAPAEATGLLSRLPRSIEREVVGPVLPEGSKQRLAELANASDMKRQLYLNERMDRRYFIPLAHGGFSRVEELQMAVEAWRPDLLIADNHLFSGAYAEIASRLNTPIVLHEALGTHFSIQRKIGVPWSPTGQSFARFARGVSVTLGALDRLRQRVFERSQSEMSRAQTRFVNDWWRRGEASVEKWKHRTLRVSCGLGVVEAQRLTGRILLDNRSILLGPLPPVPLEGSQDVVDEWLTASNVPVLLVTNGTMATARSVDTRALTAGAMDAGFRVLLANPSLGKAESYVDRDLMMVAWLDQARVLRSGAIKVFLTHGGAGAVQEAVMGGVPMICQPMDWDHHYNAWTVEQMGIGVRVSKTKLEANDITLGLRRALELTEAVHDMRSTLEAMGSEGRMRELAKTLVEE